jgi:hypothetical protein
MATTSAGISLTSVTYCEETETHRAMYDPERTRPAMAVVAAVASARDVFPEVLRPIYDSIDTDALNSVVGGATGDPVTVSFSFEGYAVTVTSAGVVELSHADSTV